MGLFSKKHKKAESYRIAFCDTPDISTKFGEWNGIFKTYEAADHCVRMGWKKSIQMHVDDAYKIDDAWLVIEKNHLTTIEAYDILRTVPKGT